MTLHAVRVASGLLSRDNIWYEDGLFYFVETLEDSGFWARLFGAKPQEWHVWGRWCRKREDAIQAALTIAFEAGAPFTGVLSDSANDATA